MITVKQYADERGITIQAVHQSMNGKRKKALLQGHVILKDGIKYLDDEAVAILDRDRRKSQFIIQKEEASETVQALKEEIEVLLTKVASQADRIAELADEKARNAVAIAEANHRQQLLEAANRDKALLEGFIQDAKAEIATLQGEAEKRAAAHSEEVERLRNELEAERSRKLTFREFLQRRKKGGQI